MKVIYAVFSAVAKKVLIAGFRRAVSGFRYYDADLGRFITRDPSGYPDGPNPYIYCRNNPINKIDPLGLKSDNVDKALINKIQDIATEVQKLKIPEKFDKYKGKKSYDAIVGSWRHRQFQKELKALNNSRILTETRINELGMLGGKSNTVIPDVLILKKGQKASDLKKGSSLYGKFDAAIDLKTGKTGIDDQWLGKLTKRIGLSADDVHTAGKGRNLVNSFANASQRGKYAKSLLRCHFSN